MAGLAARDYECRLLIPDNSAVADGGEARGLDVERFRYGGEVDAAAALRIASAIRGYRPDLIHLHSRRGADVWGLLSAVAAGVPAVVTRRVDNVEPGWLARTKAAGTRQIIAISHAIERVLLSAGVPPSQISVVHSAVEVERWAVAPARGALEDEFRVPPGHPVIAMVAQFIERKGHASLLRALETMQATGGPVPVAVLFGKGPLRESVEEEARRRGVLEWIRFPGFRDDLPRWLSSFDLLAHPAHMEGLGVAALQAGAAGIPVVGSRAGGIPEIIRHQATGLLVEPGSSEALADAITLLLSDPQNRQAMGMAARRRIQERFSVPAMVNGNIRVYEKVMGSRP